jgi:hypothetical protein
MDMIDLIMKWLVAPVGAFVYMLWTRQQDHHTDIAVLKSETMHDKLSHAGKDRAYVPYGKPCDKTLFVER